VYSELSRRVRTLEANLKSDFNLKTNMAELDELRDAKEKGLDRILALSDGVFAFALTLLVLDLAVPAFGANQDISALPALLAAEWTGFFSYFLSFIMIAVWWNTHHRYFEHVRSYDGGLKALNFLVLMTIALVPFFTKLLDTWNSIPFAAAMYAVNQGAAGTSLALTWRHVRKNRNLAENHLDRKTANRLQITSVIPPLIFFLSIPLCYISPVAAWVSWYAIFPITIIARRKYNR
jgi:TMEM175 potassium channel family protein